MNIRILLPLCAALGAPLAASGATLVYFNGDTLTPTSSAVGLAASNITFSAASTSGTFTPAGSNLSSFTGITTTGSVSVSDGQWAGSVVRRDFDIGSTFLANPVNFIAFSLVGDAADTLDLDSVVIDAAKGGAAGPRGFRLDYSVNSNFSGSSTVGSVNIANTTPGGSQFARFTFDLSSIPALASADAVYFRLYGYVPQSNQTIYFDNITVNGSVAAVPEPAAAATLLGLAACGLVATRRKRRA